MSQSESVQPDAQELRDLYNNPVQAFLDLNYAENSQYYTDYFLFALKQDSSLADTLTNTQWQNLLAGQDGQIDATKLAGLLTKFTSLTECQPLKNFLKEKPFANMDSLSAEQAHSMLNMGLDDTTTEVLKQKIVAHRQQVFEKVTACCNDEQKINGLVAQIDQGSPDGLAINGEVLKRIFLDIQQQQQQSMFLGNANLQADDITTVYVNKKVKKGAKDKNEQRIVGKTTKDRYLVTGDGKIIITLKNKNNSITYSNRKKRLAEFYGVKQNELDKVVVLQLGAEDKFELKSQVLVQQTLGAKAVKDGYFLADRQPRGWFEDYQERLNLDKVKKLVGKTFTQVIASQFRKDVMGDIKSGNVFSASENEGRLAQIFDQTERNSKAKDFKCSLNGVPYLHTKDYNDRSELAKLSILSNFYSKALDEGRDISYVDTYGILSVVLYAVIDDTEKETVNIRHDLFKELIAIQDDMENYVAQAVIKGDAAPARTEENKHQLPLLHEVLCRKFKDSTGNDLAIGDALGGPEVFAIELPNKKQSFAELDANEKDQLPQIFTDKMIGYEYDSVHSRVAQGELESRQRRELESRQREVHAKVCKMVSSIEGLLTARKKSSRLKRKKHHHNHAKQIVAEILGHGEQCTHSVEALSKELYNTQSHFDHAGLLTELDRKIGILQKMNDKVSNMSKERVKQEVLRNVAPNPGSS